MPDDPYGLDYAARLNAEQQAQQAAAVPPPLEPPFPWKTEPFAPLFFGLGEDPAPVAQ